MIDSRVTVKTVVAAALSISARVAFENELEAIPCAAAATLALQGSQHPLKCFWLSL